MEQNQSAFVQRRLRLRGQAGHRFGGVDRRIKDAEAGRMRRSRSILAAGVEGGPDTRGRHHCDQRRSVAGPVRDPGSPPRAPPRPSLRPRMAGHGEKWRQAVTAQPGRIGAGQHHRVEVGRVGRLPGEWPYANKGATTGSSPSARARDRTFVGAGLRPQDQDSGRSSRQTWPGAPGLARASRVRASAAGSSPSPP